MFKRILKIVGFVLLGFVVVIGGVVGFMAIRGDFKKQVIKPTAINFSITHTDLTFDVENGLTPTVGNGQIFSFTINAEPLDVTEKECVLKLSNPTLITFMRWNPDESKWEPYDSNKFNVNTPIYFKLNDITEANKDDYYDGVLTITVKDSSGLLQDTLELEIDRNVTSISFKDQGNKDNNTIVNGLFVYEDGEYDGGTVQQLEAIVNEDYHLEIITAPLKASKPFVNKTAKEQEIYLVEDGQPKLVQYNTTSQKVELKHYGNNGIVTEECEFLKYDIEKGCFIFNSANSGKYQFKLATYATYKIQDAILSEDLSFIERLNLGKGDSATAVKMLTKDVEITVSGTEAQNIEFNGDINSIGLQLLKDNKWVINNFSPDDNMYNLGLTLSKNSGVSIESRYNELKFLDVDTNFGNIIGWTLRKAEMEKEETGVDADGNPTYGEEKIKLNDKGKPVFAQEKIGLTLQSGTMGNVGKVSGMAQINTSADYDVEIEFLDGKYYLKLSCKEYTNDEHTEYITTIIQFVLVAEDISGRVLYLSPDENNYGLSIVTVNQYKYTEQQEEGEVEPPEDPEIEATSYAEEQVYSATYYVELEQGNCFILGDETTDEETGEKSYRFKSFDSTSSVYLVLMGKLKSDANAKYMVMNDKFVTSISQEGGLITGNSIITVKPIDGELPKYDIRLYAIVVNSNGSYYYTKTEPAKEVVVSKIDSKLTLTNNGKLNLPIIVGETISYGNGFDVEDLVAVQDGGSYSEVLLFAPEYSFLTQQTAPTEWGKGLKVFECKDGEYIALSEIPDYEPNKYYTKNNYKFIKQISVEIGENKCYLLGYIENDKFVNRVVADGANFYSKLYPVIIQSTYSTEYGRLQTAEEYINEVLGNKSAKYDTASLNEGADNETIEYDISLLEGRNIRRAPSAYVKAIGAFSETKVYYTFDSENNTYQVVERSGITQDIIDTWATASSSYYEKVDILQAKALLGDVLKGDTANLNTNLTYYTLKNDTNTLEKSKYSNGSDEFIAEWNDYYVIIDKYIIKSTEVGETDIVINTNAVCQGIELTNNLQKFKIKLADYNKEIEGKFDIIISQKFADNANVITATSYYEFTDVKPVGTFGGAYFEHAQTQVADGEYQIIAGHNKIEINWAEQTITNVEEGKTNTQTAVVALHLNSKFNEDVLQGIITNTTVTAIMYDAKGTVLGGLGDKITVDNTNKKIDYIPAGSTYIPNMQYYTKAYEKAEITAEIVEQWADKYKDYFVSAICVEFVVNETIDVGNYVKFEWKYNSSEKTYTAYSPKLLILSRNVEGYEVNVGKNELYSASLIKLPKENAPDEFYKLENGEFEKITDTTLYDQNKYYAISPTAYDIKNNKIKYLVEVGYDVAGNKYTYEVYATDGEGNLLTSDNKAIKVGPQVAFGLSTSAGGGWIKPIPFYANLAEFNIVGNDKLIFNNENAITFAQNTNGEFVDLTVVSIQDTSKQKEINAIVKPVGFTYDGPANKSSEKKVEGVLSNSYKYGSDPIDSQLQVSIKDDFKITRMGQSVESNYVVVNNQIVEKTNAENWIVKLYWNETESQWQIERNTWDQIKVNLKIVNVVQDDELTIDFTRPYDYDKNADNKTSILYSGTTFILGTSDQSNSEILYKFKAGSEATIVLQYEYNNTKTNIDNSGYDGQWGFVVPDVDKLTNFRFTIYYVEKYNPTNTSEGQWSDIGYFDLTVSPNIVMKADIDGVKNLDDYNDDNMQFDLADLDLHQYDTTKQYTQYAIDDLKPIDNNDKIKYEYETFVDEGLSQKYTTNVVSIDNHILTVDSPISKVGTYYVKLSTYLVDGDSKILISDLSGNSNVIFKVVTKSSVVSSSNKEIEPMEIVAKTADDNHSYTLSELQTQFKLARAGEIDNNFELADILWINTTNQNIEVTYKYESGELKQSKNILTYGTNQYRLLGTSYNYGFKYNKYDDSFEKNKVYYYYDNEKLEYVATNVRKSDVQYYTRSNYEFDIKTSKFIAGDGETEVTTSNVGNVYYTSALGTTIYCAKDAYLFEKLDAQGNPLNEILALSIESDGKKIYIFTIDGDEKTITKSSEKTLGEFKSLDLYYNSVNGTDKALVKNAQYVDSFDYNIELVFVDKDGVYNNIKTNDTYRINVKPYTINHTGYETVLNDTAYSLHDTVTKTGMFNIYGNTVVEKIECGASADGSYTTETIGSSTTIKFNAKGNSYATYIPVTITYFDGQTYSYDVAITVENKTVVHINYPYNVDKSNSNYETFTATVSELSKSLKDEGGNDLFDVNDLAKYYDLDTTDVEWTTKQRIKYDLALKGDTIDLTKDDLRNIVRYKTSTKIDVDTATEDDPAVAISKIELVAVSTTYVNSLQNLVDSLALNGNTISISTSLTYTGYALFKIYAGDTGAYGYYLLKIVDDAQFENVIAFKAPRNTQKINPVVKSTDLTIKDAIKNSGYSISTVANNISPDLIASDYSNVYLFVVNSDSGEGNGNPATFINLIDEDGKIETTTFNNGQLIPNNQLLNPSQQVQTVTLAVVVRSNTSLVHVCNYQVFLQPDVKVSPNYSKYDKDGNNIGGQISKVEDINYHIYQAEPFNFDFSGENNTKVFDSNYFSVTNYYEEPATPTETYTLNDAAFDGSKGYSEGLMFASDKAVKLADETIATISTTSLTLNKAVSKEVFFYLQLTYQSNSDSNKFFVVYLRITLNAFKVNNVTTADVGNFVPDASGDIGKGTFNNILDLTSTIFNGYNGAYQYSVDDGEFKNFDPANYGKIELTAENKTDYHKVTVKLTDVVPIITHEINVTIRANIKESYEPSYEGHNPTGTRVVPIETEQANDALSVIGSRLYMDIQKSGTGANIIKISASEKGDAKTYLTISVQEFTSVNFTLTSDGGEVLKPNTENAKPYRYFVNNDGSLSEDATLTDSGWINFVHSAQDVNLRLNVTVCNYTQEYHNLVKVEDSKYEKNVYYSVDGKLLTEEEYDGEFYKLFNLVKITNTVSYPYEKDTYYSSNGQLLTTEEFTGDYYRLTTGESTNLPFKPNAYYAKDGDNYKLITEGAYNTSNSNNPTSYSLYIKLPKTYTLGASYRVEGATYETVVNNKELILKATDDADKQVVDKHFLGTGTSTYIPASNVYSASKQYYKLEGEIYNPANVSEEDINDWSNARAKYYEAIVFTSRIKITLNNGTQYYGYNNLYNIGLLTNYNPNKLNYSLSAPTGEKVSSIDNGVLTFRSNNDAPDNVLTLSNATTSVDYNFKVLTEDTDYSKITYNSELLQIDSDNDKKLDYISVTHSDLEADFELGYLQYLPTSVDGQVGKVVIKTIKEVDSGSTSATLQFKFELDTASVDHLSKIVVHNNTLDKTKTYEIEITIVTLNGVPTNGNIKLIVSPLTLEYGYGKVGEDSENAFAGGQIGKLNDNGLNGKPRVTINGVSDYTINYRGAINGKVAHWYMGVAFDYDKDNSSLIYYDDKDNVIKSRSVAKDTLVTMVFDIKYKELVVGRIYYNLNLQNNLQISLNPDLDPTSAVDFYLGSKDNSVDGNITSIGLVKSDSNYNNLYVVLDRLSYQNGKQTSSRVELSSDVSQYLQFTISERYGELNDENLTIDNATGTLNVKGNPQGSFVLNVYSTNGTGYGESFAVNVHRFDNTLAQYNDQINRGTGSGFASGEEITLFKDIGSTDNLSTDRIAFVTSRIGYNKEDSSKTETPSIFNGGKVTIFYEVQVFNTDTSIKDIKKKENWTSEEFTGTNQTKIESSDLADGVLPKLSLPTVKYSVSSEGRETQIVTYRLTIVYNGESQHYFAHYLVYNESQLNINAYYLREDVNKVVTYNPGTEIGAWTDGATITLMDTKNQGMYSLLSKVNSKPDDWNAENIHTKYYAEKSVEGGGYQLVPIPERKTDVDYYTRVDNKEVESQPEDWATTWMNYYTKSGDEYVKVQYPIFKYGEYYSLTITKLTEEPASWSDVYINDGYGFKKVEGTPSFEDDTYYQIGAMKLTNQPEGWATNYGSYYKKTAIGYQPVTYSEWQADTYYSAASYTKATTITEEDWKSGYYNYYTTTEKDLSKDTWKEDEGVVFTRVPIPTFEVDKYYKLNDIASNLSGYEFYISNIKDKDGNSLPDRKIDELKSTTNPDGNITVVGRLPYKDRTAGEDILFTNQLEFTLVIKAITGSATVLADDWTIKANNTIEAKSEKRLDIFFLPSEIGNQDYYDIKIIGASSTAPSSTYDKFVENGKYTNAEKINGLNLPTPYTLYKVTYTGTGGTNVFSVENSYYVIYGTDSLMSLKLTEDYINLTIDDKNTLDKGDPNSATIDLTSYVTIWSWDTEGKLTSSSKPISVTLTGDNTNIGKVGTDSVKLSNINTLTQNQSIVAIITAGEVSRTIELYFNIVINAKDLDSNGDNENDGYMPYNEMLANAMYEKGELTSDDIDDDIDLKRELLSLVKFNDRVIATDISSLSYYTIEVTQQTDHYAIKYTYSYGASTYTRTLKMLSVIDAKATGEPFIPYKANLVSEMSDKTELSNAEISSTLRTELLNLVGVNATIVPEDVYNGNKNEQMDITVKVVDLDYNNIADYYTVTYTYTYTREDSSDSTKTITDTYTRTFKMALPTT